MMAITRALNAKLAPTDRSKSPPTMSMATPTVTIPSSAALPTIVPQVLAVSNCPPEVIEKMMKMMIPARMMPDSRCRAAPAAIPARRGTHPAAVPGASGAGDGGCWPTTPPGSAAGCPAGDFAPWTPPLVSAMVSLRRSVLSQTSAPPRKRRRPVLAGPAGRWRSVAGLVHVLPEGLDVRGREVGGAGRDVLRLGAVPGVQVRLHHG